MVLLHVLLRTLNQGITTPLSNQRITTVAPLLDKRGAKVLGVWHQKNTEKDTLVFEREGKRDRLRREKEIVLFPDALQICDSVDTNIVLTLMHL